MQPEILKDPRSSANYGRQSRAKKKSINEQLKLGRKALVDGGIDDGRIRDYKDSISASRFAKSERRDWPRLVEDIEAGEIGLICLWEVSRGDRDPERWVPFVGLCRRQRVWIYSVSAKRLYDATNAHDWKALLDAGTDAAMDSEEISLRVLRGFEDQAEEGRPHGKIKFGYTRMYDENTGAFRSQVPDTRTFTTATGHEWQPAALVVWIFKQIADNRPISEIVRFLNDNQIPTPTRHARNLRGDEESREEAKGMRWLHATVTNLVSSETYRGCRPEVPGRELWEPLVGKDLFWAVRALLANPDRRTNRGGVRAQHLLSYIARCECGEVMNSDKVRYRCRASAVGSSDRRHAVISKATLDSHITTMLLGFMANPMTAERIARTGRQDKRAVEARATAERLKGELAQARQDWHDKAKPWITYKEFEAAARALTPQIEEQERLAQFVGVPQDVRKHCGPDVADKWPGLDMKTKRHITKELLEITVAPTASNGARPPVQERVRVVLTV